MVHLFVANVFRIAMEMWLLRLNTTKCKAMTYGRDLGYVQAIVFQVMLLKKLKV